MTCLSLFLAAQNFLQLGDARLDLLQLFRDLFALHLRQAVQLQVQDGLRLAIGELPALHEAFLGLLGRLAAADELDDFVQMIERLLVTEQDVLALFGFAQVKARAPQHDFAAMLQEQPQELHQPHLARLASGDGQQDHAERFLHLRVLVEVVQDQLRLFAALDLDHHAHAVAVGFVAHVGDAFDLLGLHQLGDALDQARLVHLVGKLGDDDVFAVFAHLFDGGLGAHGEAAAALLVGLLDAFAAGDVAAGGEIGAGNQLQNLSERRVGLVQKQDGGFDDFLQVVRRDIRGHADGDAAGAVHQQIGHARRQDGGLALGLVEIGERNRRSLFRYPPAILR